MRKKLLLLLVFIFTSQACRFSFTDGVSSMISRSGQPTTAAPKATPTPTETQLPPTQTATPIPFSPSVEVEVGIFGVDWIDSGDLLITFTSSMPLEDAYYLVLGNSQLPCRIAKDSNQLLFCVGRDAAPGRTLPAALHRLENDLIVFQGTISVPAQSSTSGSEGKSSGGGSLTQVPTLPPGPTTSP